MNQEQIKKLQQRREKAWEDAKSILDAAETEGRDLNADEQGSWDKVNADMDAIDERIKTVVDAEERRKEAEDTFAKILAQPADEDKRQDKGGEESQIRSFLRGEKASHEVKPESRDLTVGTATAGGDTVPTDFYGQLVEHMIEMSGVLKANPTVLRTAGGQPIEIPKTTAHSSATLTSEGGTIAESDPAFGQATLNAYKYSVLVQVSRELIDDTAVDLLGYLARECGWAVGNKLGADLITGSGTNEPSGVVTGASLGVTGATGASGGFTSDEIIDLMYSVIDPYASSPSAALMLSRKSLGALRKLKASGSGEYLYGTPASAGEPATFDGVPVVTDPNVADTALDAKSVLFGDFSKYFVRYAGPVRFERSDEFAFNTDLVTFRCVLRGDGVLVDQTGAIKYFAGGAT